MKPRLRSGLGLSLALSLAWAGQALAQSNALDFDGTDDRVSAALPATFANLATQSFTVTAWVRPMAIAGTKRVFFAQQSSTDLATLLINSSNVPYFYVVRGGAVISINSQTPLPSNAWSHVAVRWNHATQTADVLVNGVPTNSIAGDNTSVGSDGVLMIGARSDGAQPFGGRIDDFRIWSTVRTQNELRQEMTSTCWDPAGLVAAYDFDQGVSGGDNAGVTSLPDVSGAGFDGALQNFALVGAASNWLASDTPVAAPGLVFDPALPGLIETSEDGSGFATTVRLSGAPDAALTVSFASSDPGEGTAVPSSLDFTPENWNTPQAVSFVGVDDADFDDAVDFSFELSVGGAAAACWTALTQTLDARNSSDELATLSAGNASVDEGDVGLASLVFEVTLDVDYPGGFTLPYATLDDTALAGIDYQSSSGDLVFAGTAGESQLVSVPVFSNVQNQVHRRLLLDLGAPSAGSIVGVPTQVEGTILDDDIDLSVLLTPADVELLQGASTSYSIRVENHSPLFDAASVLVDSVSVPALEGTQWTCSASGGASCAAAGSGEPSESIDLPAGSQVLFEVTGSAPASGSGTSEVIELLAGITSSVDDSDPANDSDGATLSVFGPSLFADSFEDPPPPAE